MELFMRYCTVSISLAASPHRSCTGRRARVDVDKWTAGGQLELRWSNRDASYL